MGDRLVADLGRIGKAANELGVLHDRFSNAKEYLGGYRDAIGHPGLADQMDAFHDDWRIHREKLTARLKKLADGSQNAVDAYTGLDADLAKAVQPGNGG